MWRLLIFLVLICAVAFGVTWLVDNPGEVDVTWRGMEYDFSLTVGLGIVLGVAITLGILWSIVRFVLRAPSLISLASRMRRREKGFNALTRGLIAIGSGDGRAAQKHASEARKLLGQEPLAKFLLAQAAQTQRRPRRRRRGVQGNARISRNPRARPARPSSRGAPRRRP